MNKFLLAAIFAGCLFGQSMASTKAENIVELFELFYKKETLTKTFGPLFEAANLNSEDRSIALDKFFLNSKQSFIVAYDKFFGDSDIEELLKFHKSDIGQKIMSVSTEINKEMQPAMSMMFIIKELLEKREKNNQ